MLVRTPQGFTGTSAPRRRAGPPHQGAAAGRVIAETVGEATAMRLGHRVDMLPTPRIWRVIRCTTNNFSGGRHSLDSNAPSRFPPEFGNSTARPTHRSIVHVSQSRRTTVGSGGPYSSPLAGHFSGRWRWGCRSTAMHRDLAIAVASVAGTSVLAALSMTWNKVTTLGDRRSAGAPAILRRTLCPPRQLLAWIRWSGQPLIAGRVALRVRRPVQRAL
jgi:hypothetical protein